MSDNILPVRSTIRRNPEDYQGDFAPDMYVPHFESINMSRLTERGIKHVVLGMRGTIIPYGAINTPVELIRSTTQTKVSEMLASSLISSCSIAVDEVDDLRDVGPKHTLNEKLWNDPEAEIFQRALGLTAATRVFQPYAIGGKFVITIARPMYWQRVLNALDVSHPQSVALISSELEGELRSAHYAGLFTVLVDRLIGYAAALPNGNLN